MKLPDYKANEYKLNGETYSRATKVDLKVLNDGQTRRDFWATNCETLADYLEQHIPVSAHDQHRWARKGECGTVGCALGWAAMSHIIPGLQHRITRHGGVFATINGENRGNWHEVGRLFFGDTALQNVFLNTRASKSATVAGLRREARRLRNV